MPTALQDDDTAADATQGTEVGDVAADGRVVIARWAHDDEVWWTTSGRLRHAAIVDMPAIADAYLERDGDAVSGPIMVEGVLTGDGRGVEEGAVTWDDGPWPIVWDRAEGDHTAAVVGFLDTVERRVDGDGRTVLWAEGRLSTSEDPETQAAVTRVGELLDEGAVGVSVALDSEVVEVRVPPDAVDMADDTGEVPMPIIIGAVGGSTDLPVADRDAAWDGAAARRRVLDLCSNDAGAVDVACASRAFLWRDDDADPDTQAAWSLGFADVIDDRLQIVPSGVAATAGGRGVGAADIPEADKDRIRARICSLYDRVREVYDDWPECPFTRDETVAAAGMCGDGRAAPAWPVASGRVQATMTDDGWWRITAPPDVRAAVRERRAIYAALDGAAGVDAFADPQFFGADDPRMVRQEPEWPGETVTWGAPLTVTDDGRVYGHAALWGRCHAGIADRCVAPPRGASYGRFMSGAAVDGVATGPITVGTTHPWQWASGDQAMRHYADTGRAVADVAVGDDEYGLWVAGRVRPGATDEDIAALRASPLSGDWRPYNGAWKLVGLLAVNQPGYLVDRGDRGDRDALVASIITVGPTPPDTADGAEGGWSGVPAAVTAAHGVSSGWIGAMLAADDADRIAGAVGGQPAEVLHVTLAWMGPADDIDDDRRVAITEQAAEAFDSAGAVTADAFGHAVCNGNGTGDESTWLLVESDGLTAFRDAVAEFDVSEHASWIPHIAVAYTDGDGAVDPGVLQGLMGPVTFDRVLIAFGDSVATIPLDGDAASGAVAATNGDGGDLVARVAALERVTGDIRRQVGALTVEVASQIVHTVNDERR